MTGTGDAAAAARDASPAPLTVLHEHPEWFRPLFRALDRRELPYRRLDPGAVTFRPGSAPEIGGVVLNRMSPSAYLRGGSRTIFYAAALLRHLEAAGVRVVNGARAFRVECSKALQLEIMARLGLPAPPTVVLHDPAGAPDAAREVGYPVLVKPNMGGSGAGIVRFDDPEGLERAAAEGTLEPGPDGALLVQAYVPPAADAVTRVEVLNGEVLYAIRVHTDGAGFDLCPADICRTADGRELEGARSGDPEKEGLRVEATDPGDEVRREVVALVEAAGMDVAGVEYVTDARDGRRYYFDVNANSNFVADPETVVGFDPTERLVDYLEGLMEV